jgi:hypothetical protein
MRMDEGHKRVLLIDEALCNGLYPAAMLDLRIVTIGARAVGAYRNFAYSVLACTRIGISGSASFQRVRKSV